MIRLIVSDIDGTLVPEGETRLNPEYMNVIGKLTERGIAFAAASGRQSSSMDAVFHPVREKIYYLSDNGAYIQRYGVSARELRLDPADARALLDCVRNIGGCYPLFSTTEGFYTDAQDPAFHHLVFEQYGGTGGVLEDVSPYADCSIKLSLYCPDGAQPMYRKLEPWKEKFSVNISGARWVDINAPEATKGNAVEWLQRELGVLPEETVVIGDNFNDISMLERASYSFASVLSCPEVKASARYLAGSWEVDGVLAILRRILDQPEEFLADPQGREVAHE
ncbi:MAG: HAD family hydrolase [Eubacteriales bacterium]|nr:HAD family hydrolase [Eubacteriales bacterium]